MSSYIDLKRFHNPELIYFVVTKTQNNYQYFQEPLFCEIFIEELKLCKQIKNFKLYAFSLMYDHLNLLIQPNGNFNISKIMKSLKENTSRDINRMLNKSIDFNDLRKKDPKNLRKNLLDLLEKSQKNFWEKYLKDEIEKIPKFKWQHSFYDHYIRDGFDFEKHYTYTIKNHLKHELPENWKYLSLNFEELIDEFYL